MKARTLTLVVALLLPLGACKPAQGGRAVATVSPISWNGHERISLPLALNNNSEPSIPVRIASGEVPALLDSASTRAAMEPDLVSGLGAQLRGSIRANDREFPSAGKMSVQLGPLSLALESIVAAELPGSPRFLLGTELFRHAVVDMDFDAGQVTLIHPDSFAPPAGEPLAVRFEHGLYIVPLQLKGRVSPVCAVVDTGYDGGVAFTPEMVRELGLPTYPSRFRAPVGLGGARHVGTALVPMEQLRIGGQSYREVPVTEIRPAPNRCGNLLGMAVLHQHRLVFDLGRGRMWLLPRAARNH